MNITKLKEFGTFLYFDEQMKAWFYEMEAQVYIWNSKVITKLN